MMKMYLKKVRSKKTLEKNYNFMLALLTKEKDLDLGPDPEPDPLVRGMDLSSKDPDQYGTKISRIRNTGLYIYLCLQEKVMLTNK
jgi:hypothetical protein